MKFLNSLNVKQAFSKTTEERKRSKSEARKKTFFLNIQQSKKKAEKNHRVASAKTTVKRARTVHIPLRFIELISFEFSLLLTTHKIKKTDIQNREMDERSKKHKKRTK